MRVAPKLVVNKKKAEVSPLASRLSPLARQAALLSSTLNTASENEQAHNERKAQEDLDHHMDQQRRIHNELVMLKKKTAELEAKNKEVAALKAKKKAAEAKASLPSVTPGGPGEATPGGPEDDDDANSGEDDDLNDDDTPTTPGTPDARSVLNTFSSETRK